MSADPAIRDHKTWIGYLQPDGLVVSPAALVDAQVVLDRASAPLQQRFAALVEEVPLGDLPSLAVTNLPRLFTEFLEWPPDCLCGATPERPIPESLKIPLRDFGETLEPSFAFQLPHPEDPERPWLLLAQELPLGTGLDEPVESKLAGWAASPTRRFERLLREAQVPIGLLSNGVEFRLLYAPRGENAGALTFPVQAMTEIAGRPILGAFYLLLSRYRLLAAPSDARLPALLKRSRDYQSRVSTALAQQVLDALYELLRGFQAADDRTQGALLKDVLADDPDQVYAGLLTVLMRLVFLLYAEDQGLMPDSDLYVQNYAVHGLFERLRTDAERYPDTIDSRYGAWSQLLALFRAVHRGCGHLLLKMPAREGHLFDPDRYPFLEGRTATTGPEGKALSLPRVPDGTLYRVLDKLLVLEGERLSYRTLDVEQIGSVYETMMGFRLERAAGATIALKAAKQHGAPTPINLEALLAARPTDRAKYIQTHTDYKLTATMTSAVKAAESSDDLLAALERRIARNATPRAVPRGTMVLAPTEERRRTGSHYTPRSLTHPIVKTTLEPVLRQLGEQPAPEQILQLKVCDPAMGSGAFLVEACRQLAEALVSAWASHGYQPYIPPDEDQVLHARRLVAQRCLYGVDRNPMAVDLAKLSLWLATLAKDHPFTFLDHNLRAGDSLVGLSRRQILGFDREPPAQVGFVEAQVRDRMNRAMQARRTILEAGDDLPPAVKQQKLLLADEALELVRLAGDAVVTAFFAGDTKAKRKAARDKLFNLLDRWLQRGDGAARQELGEAVRALREGGDGQHPVTPFHWEIEFPEVFSRETPGFDAVVGNPPFLGGLRISNMLGMDYFGWLTQAYPEAGHLCDLVAYFFRRTFGLLRIHGAFGLVATNSISQGDTRSGGLTYICKNGGTVIGATRRLRWPGEAAVLVSVIHVLKGEYTFDRFLDGAIVDRISAYLFGKGGDDDPVRLSKLNPLFSQGTNIRSPGFLVGDNGEATNSAEMDAILAAHPECSTRVLPYVGGEEINSNPTHSPERRVIFLSDLRSEQELVAWNPLARIVRDRVKPEREALNDNPNNDRLKREWWAYHADRRDFYESMRNLGCVLVSSQVSAHLAFVRQPTDRIYGNTLNLFLLPQYDQFAVLQSRIHESWARFFGSSMKDDLRYTPSDCFETFPFPPGVLEQANDGGAHPALEAAGREYYEFRAALMVRNNEGLTKTYNRFHDPGETSADILRLRELHDAMDRAVLDAYGWTDLRPRCEFLLDYEEEDDEEDEGGRARTRRKPYRYRWPDELRDEVLARLLKLNAERAAEERRTGAAAAAAEQAKVKGTRRGRKASSATESPPKKNRGTEPTLPGFD